MTQATKNQIKANSQKEVLTQEEALQALQAYKKARGLK